MAPTSGRTHVVVERNGDDDGSYVDLCAYGLLDREYRAHQGD